MADQKQRISRRVFLAAAGAASIAGCSQSVSTDPGTTRPQQSSDPAVETPSNVTPSPSTAPATPSPSPQLPSDDDISARFAGVTPRAWGMEMPGIVSRIDSDALALTLDACGGARGSGYDAALIDLLRRHQVPATLFLNHRWVTKNLALSRELASDPLFEIANHGTKHCPLSVTGRAAYGIAGTASPVEAWREVRDNHDFLHSELGVMPRFFRSGTAHYDDVGVEIAKLAGEQVAGFSVNGDQGARASRVSVRTALAQARAGDIILAHMNQPTGQTAHGLADALPGILDGGTRFTTLGAAL